MLGPHFIIVHCFDCSTHQWYTRHKSEVYLDYANKLKSALEAKSCKVVLNQFDSRLCDDQAIDVNGKTINYSPTPHMAILADRCISYDEKEIGTIGNFLMGAFEVYYMGVRVYSKKQSNIWPNIPMVVDKCLRAH